ncbi:Bardet-Biedl syndrome 7 protein homolog [Phlebotomus argentipes]|uniref:Bardet-Biedl syndrome 7 protein homolog n=1 Tax=Phlebotomus argentipes TaxID=94469 RepID=UPI0028930569|nr:Bardet-Biedl syndrome 7 protein homolog [Phlebotomus argentipes]
MELELTRVDYLDAGVIIPNCVKLLPGEVARCQQKVSLNSPRRHRQVQRYPLQLIIADQEGVIQLISSKKDEIQVHFKTLPGPKVASVQLGGAAGTPADKMFVAMENKVHGFSKKGKMFLSFDTNLTENIKSMFVSGPDLLVCGNHVYNHYKDCKDVGTYLCGDTIVDVVALCPNNSNRIITILACSGRVLRILEHCRVRQTIELNSVPTIMHIPKGLGDKVICGFSDGKVILYKIGHFSLEVTEEVLVEDSEHASAISCLNTFDLTGDGKEELILGRRDGVLQIFSMKSDDNEIDLESHQLFIENYNESISSVQGGYFAANGYAEVVVCTYTGRIFGLTTQCVARSISDNQNAGTMNFPNDTNLRIAKLRSEIAELESKVSREREKYQQSTQAMSSGLSAIPMLNVNDSMVLCREDASYDLSIEIPASIEYILLQSDVPLELLDVEKNTAVVSFSECNPLSGNCLLATYRCQLNTNRVDLKIRTIEGQHGTLQAYITPALQPKCSQLREYAIKPLSLHIRTHKIDETRPYSSLTLRGAFSLSEMHSWISHCVPEIPEKLSSGDSCELVFENVLIGSVLRCEYKKGEAEFKSDNISTISIIKDVLTREITKKRIKLEISTDMNPNCISHILGLVEPILVRHMKMSRDYKLLQALLELDIRGDEDLAVLCKEWQEIYKNQKEITLNVGKDRVLVGRFHGFLTDLFIDWNKFRGTNVKSKLQQFLHLLENYNHDTVLLFFGVKSDSV